MLKLAPSCSGADSRSPEAEAFGEGTRPKPMALDEAMAQAPKASATRGRRAPAFAKASAGKARCKWAL